MAEEGKKPYEAPAITHEFDLETRAGSGAQRQTHSSLSQELHDTRAAVGNHVKGVGRDANGNQVIYYGEKHGNTSRKSTISAPTKLLPWDHDYKE